MQRSLPATFLLVFLAGCATQPRLQVPGSLDVAQAGTERTAEEVVLSGNEAAPGGLRRVATPVLPPAGSTMAGGNVSGALPPLGGDAVSASLEGLPLPSFINEVYGNLLGLNFQVDPSLARRSDLVTLRLPTPQSPRELYEVAGQVLRAYGVAVRWDGAVLQVLPADNPNAVEPPLILSGRALPDVPVSHRPVFQLVEMRSVRGSSVSRWLRTAFPQQEDLKVEDDMLRNAVVLYGKPAVVRQAVAAIQVLDQPFMRGRQSTRLEPSFVSADELARRLVDVLLAEGYAAATQLGEGIGTLVLPVSSANMVLVFTPDPALLNHVVAWARTIDQPNANSQGDGLYYYQVRNTAATGLYSTLQGMLRGGGAEASADPTAPAPAAAPASGVGAAMSFSGGRVAVDEPRNAIIFQGASSDWMRLSGLIEKMDRAARQVMVEVTIAEVTLDEGETFGSAWFAKTNSGRPNGRLNFGQLPGNSTGGDDDTGSLASSGLTYLLDIAGENRLALNAFAEDQRVSILSTPRLLVMSGEEASIDVGTEVPTITLQTTSDQQTDGNTALLQGIQYRKTGILLTIKPTVYSDDRVDLEVSQEVSEALPVGDGAGISSPSIFNRKVETSLSLRDGSSVLLGGLMSQRDTNGDSGVPFLKDVPVLGYLFKNQTRARNKTELVLIIRPYIVEGDEKAQAVSDAISGLLEYIDLPPADATALPVLEPRDD
ncbi:secretin N-terminal domain-containing protein [Arenimonas sp.]|uniref:secretin N-terminal domain-containing protein n=1 Tax=Arenimonas sp. TaxID=1872635 RepID=UPI0035B30747